MHIQRLKDKVGNRSNASGEVEFDDAWGVRVGEEGRGIPTILEMASYTRLDCALASAGFIRQAFAQALHYARHRVAFGRALIDQPLMTELLADLALESEAAMRLAMTLAGCFGASADPLASACAACSTPVAKFWICKRAVALTGEAMEVFGGNGYVEEAPMGRLFREAPVNSIWEGSGNVMCLDLLRAISRNPDDAQLVLDRLRTWPRKPRPCWRRLSKLRDAIVQPPDVLEREARRFTQRLALVGQACSMLGTPAPDESAAFVGSRFDPDWGPVAGVISGTSEPAALLRAAWA